jgi:hypothetical protein
MLPAGLSPIVRTCSVCPVEAAQWHLLAAQQPEEMSDIEGEANLSRTCVYRRL